MVFMGKPSHPTTIFSNCMLNGAKLKKCLTRNKNCIMKNLNDVKFRVKMRVNGVRINRIESDVNGFGSGSGTGFAFSCPTLFVDKIVKERRFFFNSSTEISKQNIPGSISWTHSSNPQ